MKKRSYKKQQQQHQLAAAAAPAKELITFIHNYFLLDEIRPMAFVVLGRFSL